MSCAGIYSRGFWKRHHDTCMLCNLSFYSKRCIDWMLWNKNQEMFAKVRTAANWLLPLKLQALPGDWGVVPWSWDTPQHEFNKKAQDFKRPNFHPSFFVVVHQTPLLRSLQIGKVSGFRGRFPIFQKLRPPLEDVKSSVQKAESSWVQGDVYGQRPLMWENTWTTSTMAEGLSAGWAARKNNGGLVDVLKW